MQQHFPGLVSFQHMSTLRCSGLVTGCSVSLAGRIRHGWQMAKTSRIGLGGLRYRKGYEKPRDLENPVVMAYYCFFSLYSLENAM